MDRVTGALEVLQTEGRAQDSRQITVTVVGAGYAGVELAAAVAESLKGVATVQLLSPWESIMQVHAPPLPHSFHLEDLLQCCSCLLS
jgi:NADH dehydrogenase FAD-containing subunit